MTKNYDDAVKSAETYWEYNAVESDSVESLVAMGYRAALADSYQMIISLHNHETLAWASGTTERAAAARGRNGAIRILTEKLGSVARKFENHLSTKGIKV